MKTLCRFTALAVLSLSAVALSAPPAAPAAAPAAPKVAEYPLSCNAAAKALVFKGWDAQVNSQPDAARELLKQAVAADPKCVMAKASLSQMTPGAEGVAMFDEVKGQAAGLSEVEKLDLAAQVANRDGDAEKAFALAQKMQALAPNVVWVQLTTSFLAQSVERWADQEAAATKATELNPKSGAGWNLLGYAKVNQKRYDDAVVAFKKYVETSPTEPNAHDSLADALLAADKLDEALAEYEKAIETSGGKFFVSYTGVATVKALRGDWDGARAALAKLKDAATQPSQKIGTSRPLAWTFAAQGKLADALKAADNLEKESAAAKLDGQAAFAAVLRTELLLAGGKHAEALKALTTAEKAKIDALSVGQQRTYRALVLMGLVEANARLGKAADAEKAFTSLEAAAKEMTGPMANDMVTYARGYVAMAKKDAKGAVTAFQACTEAFDLCRLAAADAQDKAGDAAGATAARAALLKANHREPAYWFVHAKVEAAQKVPGKKVAKP
jgi:tetratricopeptide (TPR) repeat protein